MPVEEEEGNCVGLAVALGYMGVYGRIPGLDIFVWFVSDLGPRDRVLLSPSTTRCSAGYVTCTSGSPSTREAHLCQDRQRLFAPSLSIDRLCRRPPSSTSPQCAAQTLGKATLIPGVPPSSPQHPVDITPSAPAGTKLRTRMRLLVKRHNLQYECMRTNTSQREVWRGVRTHPAPTANGTPSNHRPKTFTDLPRELRDQIYGYATVIYPIARPGLGVTWSGNHHGTEPSLPLPSLAYVSKSIRAGALEVYLSRNIFDLEPIPGMFNHPSQHLTCWRRMLGPLVTHVRRIKVRLSFRHAQPTPSGREEKRRLDNFISLSLLEGITITHTVVCQAWHEHSPSASPGDVLNYEKSDHCVCDLVQGLETKMQATDGYHGGLFLHFTEGMLSGSGKEVKDVRCAKCDKVKLVAQESARQERGKGRRRKNNA